MIFRIVNGFMVVIFLVAAVIQYNDPDPVRWILIYGAAAVAALLQVRREGEWARRIPLVVGLAALIWALFLVPEVLGQVAFQDLFQSMDPNHPEIEEGRELGGLLIIALWMGVLVFRSRKGRPEGGQPAGVG